MAKYTKKQAERGIRFWKKALTEAIAAESEEDQEKEKAAGEQAEDPKDAEIEELKAKVAELEAQLATGDGEEDSTEAGDNTPDEDSEEDSDDAEDIDVEVSDEDSVDDDSEDSEEDSDDEDSDDDDSEEDSDEEDEDSEDDDSEEEEIDEAAPGSARFAPNTVGAVCELLKKSDPNDELLI